MHTDVILKRLEQPDATREPVKGRDELVHLGGLTIGRATYQSFVSLHFLGADHYAR